jgi:aminocarboxymuconate-semialdehyde decarboxylase
VTAPVDVERGASPLLHDEHAHWLPERLLSLLARRDQPPFARRSAAGWSFTASLRARPLPAMASDLGVRVHRLAAAGIGQQTLCLSPLWNIDSQPLEVSLPLVRAFNDATAAAAAGSGTYRGLAAVPLADVDAACAELARAVEAGLQGLVLSASVLADRVAVDAWAPLFALAQANGLRVFVHPGHAAASGSSDDNAARKRRYGLEPQHQIGLAMLALCDSGWVAAYPNITLQFANLGGSYTFCLERLDAMQERSSDDDARRRLAMRRVVVDSASLGPEAIRCARALLGERAVVFGTDTPMFDAARAAASWEAAASR